MGIFGGVPDFVMAANLQPLINGINQILKLRQNRKRTRMTYWLNVHYAVKRLKGSTLKRTIVTFGFMLRMHLIVKNTSQIRMGIQ